MAEYIERERLEKVLRKGQEIIESEVPNEVFCQAYLDGKKDALGACLSVVWAEPAADVAPVVHGQWLGAEYDGFADGCPVYETWQCSACFDEVESEGDPPSFNYCPNCGAKMEGGSDNAAD